jgi:hypothetical protein
LNEIENRRVDKAKRNRLTNRDALDVEDQVRVGGNVRRCALLAVRKRGRDSETTLATGSYASDTNVPALDYLAGTELERERLALLVGFSNVSIRKACT